MGNTLQQLCLFAGLTLPWHTSFDDSVCDCDQPSCDCGDDEFVGCCHVNSLSLQVDVAVADHVTLAASFHASNALRRWSRIVRAARRRVGTEKLLRVADCMDAKLCNPPGDQKPLHRSLSFSEGQMAVLCSVIEALVRPVIKAGGSVMNSVYLVRPMRVSDTVTH